MTSPLWHQFLLERQYIKNVTSHTVRYYHDCERIWHLHHADCLPTSDSLKHMLIHMQQAGMPAGTVNIYMRGINAWVKWLHEAGHLPTAIPRIKPLRCSSKVIATFSEAQVRVMLQYKPRCRKDHRLLALITLLLDTGMRIEEALTLERPAVDLNQMLVRVLGKGRKERIIPISQECRKVLYRWLTTHHHSLCFPTRDGGRLLHRNIYRDFRVLCERLNITGVRCSFHTLRHTFATFYIRSGGDVFRLQRVLGHSSLEMTKRYLDLQIGDLSQAHERMSVVAKLKL